MRSASARLAVLPIVTIVAAALVGCPVNPATGERQLILISESQEIEMGREASQQVAAVMGLYPNEELQAYVSRIGHGLAATSEKPDLPWSFKVVDDVTVNAFALPGGFIFVTRGILANFNSEAELAGVLGHEIGHVTARHSAEQLSRAQVAQLGLVAGSVFVPEFSPYAGLAQQTLGLLFLKFSRDDERQADDLGFRYMRNARYDPTEMVDVFDMLGRVSKAQGGSGIPSWLSTHPDPGERRERMQEALAEAGGSLDGKVGRDNYLQMIDGLVFGEDPREGYFEGSLFLHPDLEFRFEFPEGWRTQNTRQAVAGLSPDEDALIQLSLASATSVGEAASEFLGQEGVRAGERRDDRINGLTARWNSWSANAQDGTRLSGLALFVAYEGRVYEILAYTPQSRLSKYRPIFQRSLGSFARLTDPDALSVEAMRVRVVKLERAMTLREFSERYPSAVDLATLALINGVGEDETLAGGALVKRIVGGSSGE